MNNYQKENLKDIRYVRYVILAMAGISLLLTTINDVFFDIALVFCGLAMVLSRREIDSKKKKGEYYAQLVAGSFLVVFFSIRAITNIL